MLYVNSNLKVFEHKEIRRPKWASKVLRDKFWKLWNLEGKVWYCKGVQKKNFKVYKQPWKTWSIFFNSWCVIKQCFLAPLISKKRSKRKLRKVLIYRKFDRMNNKALIPFSSFIALRNPCSIHRHVLCTFRAKFQGVIQWLYCWLLLDSRRKRRKHAKTKRKEEEHEEGGRSVPSCTESEHFYTQRWNLKGRDYERGREAETWHRLYRQLSSEFLLINKNLFLNHR